MPCKAMQEHKNVEIFIYSGSVCSTNIYQNYYNPRDKSCLIPIDFIRIT